MAPAARPPGPADPSDDEVDFVVGRPDEAPDEDEDLPSGPGERRTRLRVAIGVGVAVLLVGVFVTRAVTASHSTPQAAPTSASPTAVPTPTGPVTAPPYVYRNNVPGTASATPTTHVRFPSDVPSRTGSDPAVCPRSCAGATTLPAGVNDAVQAAFPESTVERSRTIRLGFGRGPLWFREIDIRAGEQQIEVRVQARSASDTTSAGYTSRHGQITTFYRHRLGPWQVEVDAVDLLGGRADLSVVRRLGRDPRITVVRG